LLGRFLRQAFSLAFGGLPGLLSFVCRLAHFAQSAGAR